MLLPSAIQSSLTPRYFGVITQNDYSPQFNTVEKQRKSMETLFHKLQLKSLDDWTKIKQKDFLQHPNTSFIRRYYANNMKKLLKTLYPNYPWDFPLHNKEEYFQQFENQRTFMNTLFFRLELTTLADFLRMKYKIIAHGGKLLLYHYCGDYIQLLTAIYPNYPWLQLQLKLHSHEYFKNKSNRREFMNTLFTIFDLTTLEDWKRVSRHRIIENGGKSLVLHYYDNNLDSLLAEIYPNYPWGSFQPEDDQFKSKQNKNIQYSQNYISDQQHRYYFIELFSSLQLSYIADFMSLSSNIIRNQQQLNDIIDDHISNDHNHQNNDNNSDSDNKEDSNNEDKRSNAYHTILTTIFQNYPWSKKTRKSSKQHNKLIQKSAIRNRNIDDDNDSDNNDERISQRRAISKHQYFKSKRNQRHFMNDLYEQFGLRHFDEWTRISRNRIIINGGKSLVRHYYNNNIEKLLRSIYTNYPWEYLDRDRDHHHRTKSEYFRSIANQRSFMAVLFEKLKMKTMDEWMYVAKSKIGQNGGGAILEMHKNDMKRLLSSVYPHYPWRFEVFDQHRPNEYFKSAENQRTFMNVLFHRFQLSSLEDFLFVSKKKIIRHGGQSLVMNYFENDMKTLLMTIYPNFPWQFDRMRMNKTAFFRSYDNQRSFMNRLFQKFDLRCFDDWNEIPKTTIMNQGGYSLISHYYNDDLPSLFRSVYPNYPWQFVDDISLISTQRSLLTEIAIALRINDIDDWKKVTRHQMLKHGGKKLLLFYDNDMQKLLSTLYPQHRWQFIAHHTKFQPHRNYFKSSDFLRKKLIFLITRFRIQRHNDWYRLPRKYDEVNVFDTLNRIFPHVAWNRSLFSLRGKKVNQRFLYSIIQNMYSSHILLEDYRHPLMMNVHYVLEFDIFIPSLNFAFEYQGEHHFNDLPAVFNYVEDYQTRDNIKESLAYRHSISLIIIPYWWDHSESSLRNTILSQCRNSSLNV